MVGPVCRNVKRSPNATAALRWTAVLEAAKGLRRLKAYKPLRALRAAVTVYHLKFATGNKLEENLNVA
jgi:hypothetical protein